MKITWDGQGEDDQDDDNHVESNHVEDNRKEGSRAEDSLGWEAVVHSRKGARMMAEVDTRLWEEQVDLYATSAEKEALPSPVKVRTYHLFYPFPACAVPAIIHDDISKLNRTKTFRN